SAAIGRTRAGRRGQRHRVQQPAAPAAATHACRHRVADRERGAYRPPHNMRAARKERLYGNSRGNMQAVTHLLTVVDQRQSTSATEDMLTAINARQWRTR